MTLYAIAQKQYGTQVNLLCDRTRNCRVFEEDDEIKSGASILGLVRIKERRVTLRKLPIQKNLRAF